MGLITGSRVSRKKQDFIIREIPFKKYKENYEPFLESIKSEKRYNKFGGKYTFIMETKKDETFYVISNPHDSKTPGSVSINGRAFEETKTKLERLLE